MSVIKLGIDRNILISSRKDVRTDLAIRYAKQELDGELFSSSVSGGKSDSIKPSVPLPAPSTAMPTGLDDLLTSQLRGHSPIIILPSSAKARISAMNAVDFLIHGKYIEPSRETKRPESMPIEIEKTICGRQVRFRLFDDVTRFRKDDWKSVVAVFFEGKFWQFSGWPFRSESDLFASLAVFHLRYADDPVDAAVSGSRIKSLVLKRGARHEDSSVMIEFWKSFENWLSNARVKKFSNTARLP